MKALKAILCVVGILLFASNPWRDYLFFDSIAANEGFGTSADAWWLLVAYQFIASAFLLPIAIVLILYGIIKARAIPLVPNFERFTGLWGTTATVLALVMLLVEMGYVVYAVEHFHHWGIAAISAMYIVFIYFWWLCSISHGPLPNNALKRDAASAAPLS